LSIALTFLFAPAPGQTDTSQTVVPLNINNHLYFISNRLLAGRDFLDQSSGSSYPARVFNVAYEDDLEWGGYVTADALRELRVNGAHYNVGVTPGPITTSALPPSYIPSRVYRIRKDYATADLHQDAADYFRKAVAKITQQDIDLLRRQYACDWGNWPISLGAPFYDTNGNGLRDPGEDPGLLDADMVCWSTVNDLDPYTSEALYGSLPIGMEVQSTWWGYKGKDNPLAHCVFVRYRIIFRGTPTLSPAARIDSLYLTKFVDPDLGFARDDLLGCDTTLQLGYVYNGNSLDSWNEAVVPPVVGWQLLQGPLVAGNEGDIGYSGFIPRSGMKNLRLSSFYVQVPTASIEPPVGGSSGLFPAYRSMRGFFPDQAGPLRLPLNELGQPTYFKYSGDPVTRTGDIDGLNNSWSELPGEVRFKMNMGPFSMARGDTQEVVCAVIGATGEDHIRIINNMKWYADVIQRFYPNLVGVQAYNAPAPGPNAPLPSTVVLWNNYPNPFNPGTTFRFDLPLSTVVHVTIYDILGRSVRTLVDGVQSEGTHFVDWDGKDAFGRQLPSGAYFCRLQAYGMMAVKRMLLVR
jgi:hypothetical protein